MKELPFAEQLSPEGRALLARAVVEYHFPAGRGVIAKGQPVSGAYFVLKGQLRVSTLTPAGREATLYALNPGDTCILALNSLFNDLLYPAWVQTEEETIVAVVPGAAYRALFEREPSVQALTVKALSSVVFRLMAELEEVHSCTLEQRLANFILTHAAANGALRMTQQTIAGHLGASREGVARLLAELAARRLIRTARGEVVVLDQPKLLAVMRAGQGA